jgi:hypothetical protein
MRSAAIALLLLAGTAFPLVVGYHVDPGKAGTLPIFIDTMRSAVMLVSCLG